MAEKLKTDDNKTQSLENNGELKSANTGIEKQMKSFDFRVGDTVKVNYKITEGDKSRVQPYTGIVIAKKGKGVSKTFTVRRIAHGGVGVERIFPLYSPNVDDVVVKSRGKARRAKLYYLRKRVGKAAVKVKQAS